MIILEEGCAEMLPWVKVELEPSSKPLLWRFEVFVYTPDNIWTHYWQHDGSGWGLWNTWHKARQAAMDVWSEVFQEMNPEKKFQTWKSD
jgi:hypothetical protein